MPWAMKLNYVNGDVKVFVVHFLLLLWGPFWPRLGRLPGIANGILQAACAIRIGYVPPVIALVSAATACQFLSLAVHTVCH